MTKQKLSQHAPAPWIISDSEAREIAHRMVSLRMGVPNCTQDDLRDLATDGRIGATLYRAAPSGAAHPFADLRALLAYVSHHGERGPVPNWRAKVESAAGFTVGDRVEVPPRTFTGKSAPGGPGVVTEILKLDVDLVDLDVHLDSGERRTPPASMVERVADWGER
jgi:hypothetical protein